MTVQTAEKGQEKREELQPVCLKQPQNGRFPYPKRHIKSLIAVTVIAILSLLLLASNANLNQTVGVGIDPTGITWVSRSNRNMFNGHEYLLVDETVSWPEAKVFCEALGGHLVTITSSEENDFVDDLARETSVWIGFSDETTDGDWQWVTGESVTYTNWLAGQPDNAGEGEDHAMMGCNGAWYTEEASMECCYVCEWEGEDERALFNGNEYKLIKMSETWEEAKISCEALGGHLVTLTGCAETEFVADLASGDSIWIGFVAGAWITGERVTHSNWLAGQTGIFAIMGGNGAWYTEEASIMEHYYVCEWERDERALFNGNEYKFIRIPDDSWYRRVWGVGRIPTDNLEACASCEALGGHLVTITSSEENDFVNKLAEHNPIWIGLTDKEVDGWQWITGEKVSYTNWKPEHPENIGLFGVSNYAVMDYYGEWVTPFFPRCEEAYEITPSSLDFPLIFYVCEWEDSDSDGDGMGDWWENHHGLDPADPSDAALDKDGDGMTNFQEFTHAFNASDPSDGVADNDGDWISNAYELKSGSNPFNARSFPLISLSIYHVVAVPILLAAGLTVISANVIRKKLLVLLKEDPYVITANPVICTVCRFANRAGSTSCSHCGHAFQDTAVQEAGGEG